MVPGGKLSQCDCLGRNRDGSKREMANKTDKASRRALCNCSKVLVWKAQVAVVRINVGEGLSSMTNSCRGGKWSFIARVQLSQKRRVCCCQSSGAPGKCEGGDRYNGSCDSTMEVHGGRVMVHMEFIQ
jgi:hypothetical protein